jgi:hypothetical protein
MEFKKICAALLALTLTASSFPLASAAESDASASEPASSGSSSSSVEEDSKEEEPASIDPSTLAQPEQAPASDFEKVPDLASDTMSAYEPFMTNSCESTGHQPTGWNSNGDSTMTAKCTLCGKELTADCEFTDTVIPPKCIIGGSTLHTCSLCSYTYEDELTAPVGHNYVLTTDSETSETCYTCSRCGAGFRRPHNSLAITFLDGRAFSSELVDSLTDYLAKKDDELNKSLVLPDKNDKEAVQADEFQLSVSTKSVKKEEVSDPEEVESYVIETDPVSVITYLETLYFQDSQLEVTEEALKKEIDQLYEKWYTVSSAVVTLPNPDSYADSADYETDLEASLKAIEEGKSIVSLQDAVVKAAYGDIGHTSWKYIDYYNKNLRGKQSKLKASEPWCSEFVTWCLFSSGISHKVSPSFMAARHGVSGFDDLGCLHWAHSKKDNYTPQPGDVVFFSHDGKTSSHTGLVTGIKNGKLITVERSGDKVKERSRKLSDSYIYAYGEVKYTVERLTVNLTVMDAAKWCSTQWSDNQISQQLYDLLCSSISQEEEPTK